MTVALEAVAAHLNRLEGRLGILERKVDTADNQVSDLGQDLGETRLLPLAEAAV